MPNSDLFIEQRRINSPMLTCAKLLLTGLLLIISSIVTRAQQPVALTPAESAIKAQADKLSPHAPIHILCLHAPEQFGTFVSNDQQGFTFYNLPSGPNITLPYADVKSIKKGFGGFDPNTGKRKSHKEAVIITAVAVVVLISGLAGGIHY